MKFAVCVVGHTRAWSTNPECRQSFIDNVCCYNPDVYVDIYDEITYGPRLNHPTDVRNPIKYTKEEHLATFEGVSNIKHFDVENVDSDWVNARWGESLPYLRGNDTGNNYKTYCLLRKVDRCYQALKASAIKYDVILFTRPHMRYLQPIIIDGIEDGWIYNAPYGGPSPEDAIVMGNERMMDIFVSRFAALNDIYRIHTHMGACPMDSTMIFRYVCCRHGLDWRWRHGKIQIQYLAD